MAIGFAQHADSHGHFPIDSHASCVAQATRKKVSFATWVQFELAVGGLLHTCVCVCGYCCFVWCHLYCLVSLFVSACFSCFFACHCVCPHQIVM